MVIFLLKRDGSREKITLDEPIYYRESTLGADGRNVLIKRDVGSLTEVFISDDKQEYSFKREKKIGEIVIPEEIYNKRVTKEAFQKEIAFLKKILFPNEE